MVDEEALRDRYRGALLASACGDALGATLEFMPREEIQEQFGTLRDIVGGGWLHLHPGDVTDDTQMMLCIGHSIVQQGAFDPEDIAARFLAWYRTDPPDVGKTTGAALAYLDQGLPWDEAGERGHRERQPNDASNGSIMRCAPVALYARGNPQRNVECSAISSRITHANPLSINGVVALNAAIARLLDDPASDFLAVAREATSEPDVQQVLDVVPGLSPADLSTSGYVLDTLQAAFWAVREHETLEDAVIAAVNLGQDADTTGAVTGALAGARWGADAIPTRWLDKLIPADELLALADELYSLSESLSPSDD